MNGILPGGALYEIVLTTSPFPWNSIPDNQRILIVYAHGYVDPGKPVALPSDMISDGIAY